MDTKDTAIQAQKEIKVDARGILGSQYAQLVSVTVTDYEITFEFVWVNPRDNSQGQLLSRITMPVDAGKKFAESILATIEKHATKKKGN
mgnify:FL=1